MPALFGLAPEVALSLILLAAFCSYLAYRGMLSGWQHTFGLILVGSDGQHGIAGLLSYSKTIFGRHIGFDFGRPIRAANTAIVNTLQQRIADAEEDMAWTWHKMGQVWQAMSEATNWLSHSTTATFHWLTKVHLPKWLAVFAPPFLLTLLLPKLLRAILAHVKPGTIKIIKTIDHALPAKIVQVFKFAGAAAIPGVIGLPKVWHEIHGLTKRWARLNHRLRKVEALLGAAAFAGLMANALGVTKTCIRRGNVGRVARAICGLDSAILGFLLAGLAIFETPLSIEELAHEYLSIMDDVLGVITSAVTEVRDVTP